jgi:hypothetical protein
MPQRDNASESRDVVFGPNLVESPVFHKVYKKFMDRQGQRKMASWTCKKTAKPGDLYLFYFGNPEFKIAGLAVCRQSPDPVGWRKRGWGSHQKMFFCPWDALHHFSAPITAGELQAKPGLDSWWQTKPYRGRPKTIPPEISAVLLQMIAKREPKVGPLLKSYIDEDRIVAAGPKTDGHADALEGTPGECLTRQPARSAALRREKIRRAMAKNGRLVCEVPGCGFDFFEVYGELGRGYAHVHHRESLAKRRKMRTTLDDLAIVCANCHGMVHHGGQCRPLRGLIARISD